MPAGNMFAKLVSSVAVGFLGAYPLASSSGLMGTVRPDQQDPIIITSGIILGFLTLALIGPTIRLVRQVLEALGRVEDRPRPPVALAMLVLGTICAMSAMQIQLSAANRPPASVSMNIPGFTTTAGVAAQPSSSLGLGILTLLTFLLGAALIGLGIWASVKPSAPAIGTLIKPEAREFAEVAT